MTIAVDRLAKLFVEFADTLVDEFDVVEFLQLVAERTAELFGYSQVGLLLADDSGRLGFAAASDENVRLVELFQIQRQEGPCLEAFRSGAPVLNADLRKATPRWPTFGPRAAAAGFLSVHAFPLRLRSVAIGALNVFSVRVGGLAPSDVEIVQALADVAAIGLLQQRAIVRGELLAEQLQAALNTRILIEQAKGIVAQARQVSVDKAFGTIRAYARRNNLRLNDVAVTVVTDLASIPDLAVS